MVDDLKRPRRGYRRAFPQTTVQTFIVHLIHNSLDYASCKDRKLVAAAIRPIYAAPSETAAKDALQAFAADRGARNTRP